MKLRHVRTDEYHRNAEKTHVRTRSGQKPLTRRVARYAYVHTWPGDVRLTAAAYAPSVIDLHSHVLPGIDDGPADLAGALALARAAARAGTRVLVATPHIGTAHEVDPLTVAARVWELERALERERIPLELAPGGEVAPAGLPRLSDAELAAIGLGGSRCVLLECPFSPVGHLIDGLVDGLHDRGMRVLLAHPERSPSLVRDPDRVEEMVASGAHVQVTAAALAGGFGTTAWRFCSVLLERGLVHAVASDAHDAVKRPPELASIVRRAIWEQGLPDALVSYLLHDAPAALLADAPVPEAPVTRRRRRAWRR